MELRLTILSLCLGLVSSEIGELQNVAGKAGDTNVFLEGQVTNPETYVLAWQIKPWDSTGNPQDVYQIIGGGSAGEIKDPFKEEFEVRSGELHSLYAKSLKWANAGKFTRTYTSSAGIATEYADLVTVGDLRCPESRDYDEGDAPQIMCSVDYTMTNADTDGPVLQWYLDGREVETIKEEPDESATPAPGAPRTASYYHNFTVEAKHHQAVFECRLKFTNNMNGLPPPVYTDNCTVSFNVQYFATKIDFSPDPNEADNNQLDLKVGDVINCTADGNPAPKILWTKIEGDGDFQHDQNRDGQFTVKLTMTDSLNRYNVSAEQTIDNLTKRRYREIAFTADGTASGSTTLTSTLQLTLVLSLLAFISGKLS